MNSLLIGKGQIFSLIHHAFIKTNSRTRVIGEDVQKKQIFKNKNHKEITLKDVIRGSISSEDLGKIDSIFVSHYDREKLLSILKLFKKIKVTVPVFILSTAINQSDSEIFPDFQFLPTQTLFSTQIENVINRCEFLFKVGELAKVVKPNEKVLIMIFENPDPDAIASAMALKLLLSKLKVRSKIAYTGHIVRLQNKIILKEINQKFYKIKQLNLSNFDKLALVDAQPYFFEGKYKFDIVIDHHPKRERLKVPFQDVRTKVGSTSTIMTQYLLNSGVKINRKLATALLYGIKTDTNNLERHILDEDIRSFRYLYSKSDKNLLKKIELSEVPVNALSHFEYAMKNYVLKGKKIYVNLGKVDIPEVQVMVADFLLKLEEISNVVVSAVYDNTLIIIFRNHVDNIDAGAMASKAFSDVGHAGGHDYMARAEIGCEAIKTVCKSYNKKAIDSFILKRLKWN